MSVDNWYWLLGFELTLSTMCGIFGFHSSRSLKNSDLRLLATSAFRRGQDSSGLVLYHRMIIPYRSDSPITKLVDSHRHVNTNFAMGHGRLITNSTSTNQPVISHDICVIHNGIIINVDEIWNSINMKPTSELDTEVVPALISTLGPSPDLNSIKLLLDSSIKGSDHWQYCSKVDD